MSNITLVAIDFLTYDMTRYGIEHTLKHVDAKEVVVISDREIFPGAKHIMHEPVTNMRDYNQVMLKEVAEHVNTSHSMFVQWDGMANDSTLWTDEFLKYDYIGAPWPWEPEGRNIGNGGFSLRSRRLLDACLDNEIALSKERNYIAEDAVIGIDKRSYLEETHGIKFAPTQLARRFSFELGVHEPSFGFHGLWNIFNFLDDDAMDFYWHKIDYAGWNVYKWHHTLAAVLRRERMDIYEYMLQKLEKHSPEHLEAVADWLDRDSRNPSTGIRID